MDVRYLTAKPRDGASDHEICHLIGAIGTSRFEDALLSMAHQSVRCTHLTAFSFANKGLPRVLIAANSGSAPVARHLASKYISNYWQLDPANIVLDHDPRIVSGATIRLQSHEIENSAYRRDCYRSVDLIDRFSIIKSVGNDVIRLNFYREASQGKFSDTNLDAMSALAEILIQVIGKHDSLRLPVKTEDRYNQYCKRLNLSAPQLSSREMQICAQIVLGLSSEAIASKLSLSVNTILSHRRRAYAKLKISSQNELSHMLLQ